MSDVNIMKFCARKLSYLAIIVTIFSTFVACAGQSFEDEVYEEFKRYRIAISEDQRTSFRYFSKKQLEGLLKRFMYTSDPFLLRAYENTQRLYLYGGNVDIVHYRKVKPKARGVFALELHFSNTEKNYLRSVTINYIRVGDRYLIDSFEFFVDSLGEIPTEVVDDFSQYTIPTVSEVLGMETDAFRNGKLKNRE